MENINSENFDERVLKSPTMVLVDFAAPWCQPCKAMAPHLQRLQDDGVDVVTVDVDDNYDISERYQIKGLPTVIKFEQGKETQRIIGTKTYDNLKKEIFETKSQ